MLIGYHYNHGNWAPSIGDILQCEHEGNNAFDIFAIKVCNSDIVLETYNMARSKQ